MNDDELPMELVTEPAPRPPRRWPQAALLLAAVAVVIGVGMVDDGSDETSLPTTTTTTAAPTKRTTTTRPVHRVTTTEVVPHTEPGDGPLLPDAAGTHLLLLREEGRVDVVDLATGSRCVNTTGDRETWMPFGASTSTGAVPLQTSRGLVTVDARCGVSHLTGAIGDAEAYPAGRTDDAIWFMQDGTRLTGIGLDGAPGRTITLPANTGVWVAGAGRRLLLGAAGSITLVDPATNARRDLGTGTPVAANADSVALVRCPKLECSLSLLDISTGRRRPLGDSQLASVVDGSFSPDGRHFAASVNADTLHSRSFVVDLRTNDTTEVDADAVIGFTAGSRWLLLRSGSEVVAVRPDGTDRRVVTSGVGGNGQAVLVP